MKRFYYILAVAGSLFLSNISLQAQEEAEDAGGQQQRRTPQASRGERANDKKDTGTADLTVRAQDMNERMTQEVGNARWMRVIYRQIDLMKEKNAPLYYPVTPLNGQMNLFSIIFNLVVEGKIDAYQYEDGYEDFSEGNRIDLKKILDSFGIYYEEVAGKGREDSTFIVNEGDIPSESVRSYYVKEAWYFDQNNSVFDVKTLAICPIMTSAGDVGELTMPMFWIPYENIRPYVTTALIMTSNTNNAMTFTIDDYFRRRMFEGEIIKTQNLLNRPLQAYCPTPDSLKREQENIEAQLTAFEKALWMQPDTTQAVAAGGKDTKKAKTVSARSSKTTTTKEKTVKTKAPKAEKSSPVRSVRRR